MVAYIHDKGFAFFLFIYSFYGGVSLQVVSGGKQAVLCAFPFFIFDATGFDGSPISLPLPFPYFAQIETLPTRAHLGHLSLQLVCVALPRQRRPQLKLELEHLVGASHTRWPKSGMG